MFPSKLTESPPRLELSSAGAFAGGAAHAPRFDPVTERRRSGRSQRSAVTAGLVLSRHTDRPTGPKER